MVQSTGNFAEEGTAEVLISNFSKKNCCKGNLEHFLRKVDSTAATSKILISTFFHTQ